MPEQGHTTGMSRAAHVHAARNLFQSGMGIRYKLLLAFFLSFVSIGVISFQVLQVRLQADFDALEEAEMKTALSQSTAVIEDMVSTLKSVTIDWSVWTEMYEFARKPKARTVWATQNIGPDSALNANFSFFEILDPQAHVTWSSNSGKDGSDLALDEPMREWLVRQLENSGHSDTCFFLSLAKRQPSLLCAHRISRSDESGSFVGVMATVQVFSAQRMTQTQGKLGARARFVTSKDIAPQAQWVQTDHVAPHAGMGRVAHWSLADTRIIQLPLRGMSEVSQLSLELQQPRTIHVQSRAMVKFLLAQSITTSFVASLVLTLAVHGFLIRRLRSFHQQLTDISQGSGKVRRIKMDGHDEIALLAKEVNGLLETIEIRMDELTAQSMTDPLTGLSNRRAFDLRLALECSRSERAQQLLALLLLDVDHFKPYNDHYGHQQGDVALQRVAQVLGSITTRATDLAARIGGEEFAVLLPAASLQGAQHMAQVIQERIAFAALPHAASSVAPTLTVSIGVAMLAAPGGTPAEIFALADSALYEAKTLGRNRIVVKGGSAMDSARRPPTEATDPGPSGPSSAL